MASVWWCSEGLSHQLQLVFDSEEERAQVQGLQAGKIPLGFGTQPYSGKYPGRRITCVNLGVFWVRGGLWALRLSQWANWSFWSLVLPRFSTAHLTPGEKRNRHVACSSGRVRTFRFCPVYRKWVGLWLLSGDLLSWQRHSVHPDESRPWWGFGCIFFCTFMASLNFAVFYLWYNWFTPTFYHSSYSIFSSIVFAVLF